MIRCGESFGRAFMLAKAPNKTVQATPMNAAVLSLRSRVVLCHSYGVPDLFR